MSNINLFTPASLLHAFRVHTLLDFIMGFHFHDGRYDFTLSLNPHTRIVRGTYHNGCGDSLCAEILPHHALVVGLGHESQVWQLILDQAITPNAFYKNLPAALLPAIQHPPWPADEITFCFWYDHTPPWKANYPWKNHPSLTRTDPDGSEGLLAHLNLSRPAVDHIFHERFIELLPQYFRLPDPFLTFTDLTSSDILDLNPKAHPTSVLKERDRLLSIHPA